MGPIRSTIGSARAGIERALQGIESTYGNPYMPEPDVPDLKPYEATTPTVLVRSGLSLIAGARARAKARYLSQKEADAQTEQQARQRLLQAQTGYYERRGTESGPSPLDEARAGLLKAQTKWWEGRPYSTGGSTKPTDPTGAARARISMLENQFKAFEEQVNAENAHIMTAFLSGRRVNDQNTAMMKGILDAKKAARLAQFRRQQEREYADIQARLNEYAGIEDSSYDPLSGLKEILGGQDDPYAEDF